MRNDPLAFLSTELDSLKQQGLYRKLRVLDGKPEAHTTYDHKSVVNLSSNNYLGLTTHPKLVAAALDAVQKYGVGSGAVRTISGTMEMHMELERRLATFKHVESVVVFQSGFAANAGTVAAVLTKDDVIISDELNHASIIDGCRLSKAPIKVFPHKDVDAARKIMKDLPAGAKEDPDHRRRVLDGWRPRPRSRAVHARGRIRRDHDGGRCACQRGVRQERQRHRRSLRLPRPRRHPGRHACRRRSASSADTSRARRT